MICGVFIYNLKPPTKARRSTNTESQDKDKSHNRKGDGTASRGGGGLLETQTCLATVEHVALQLEDYMEALKKNPPSHQQIQPSVSMQSSHELLWNSECKCVVYACIPLSVCVHIQHYVLIIM